MASTPVSTEGGGSLPAGFTTIKDIQECSSSAIRNRTRFSVVGFVRDHQVPTATYGSDWKCAIEITDHSIKDESVGLKLNIFCSQDAMPEIAGLGDFIVIQNATVQLRNGIVSLIKHHTTRIHMLPSDKIPSDISLAHSIKWISWPKGSYPPGAGEACYAIWANKSVDQLNLPALIKFQTKAAVSHNVKNKFSLLRDITVNKYHDLIGEVVKIYDPGDQKVTVYLTDYTANSNLFDYEDSSKEASKGRDGDDNGYITIGQNQEKSWPGPFGKMTIQVTLWEGNASFARSHLKPKQWIKCSNVHIKPSNYSVIEGALHGDRDRAAGESRIKILGRPQEDPTEDDKRFMEGIERHRTYWNKYKQQKKTSDDEEKTSGEKRRRGEDDTSTSKMNSKQRRKERRAALEKEDAAKSSLNPNIKCAYPDRAPVRLSEVLKPTILPVTSTSTLPHTSPFTNTKYRSRVRVVDYFPHNIEEFAVSYRPSIYEILPDHVAEESDSDEDPNEPLNSTSEKIWEWRFALAVEDLDPDANQEKEALWLQVDNQSAQHLLNIEEDASCLRTNNHLLQKVKNQLFLLWGNLEEIHTAKLSKLQPQPENDLLPPSSFNSEISTTRKVGAQPNLESSDVEMEEEWDSGRRQPNGGLSSVNEKGKEKEELRNRGFVCCIKQYGIKLRVETGEGDEGKWRWQRMFMLDRTQIL